jgi:Leucine-rich repeat (LRR) protein
VKNLTNLTSLQVGDNSVEDISAIEGLVNLTWLDLRFNSISDISPLDGLINLIHLFLDGNNIIDISPLAANEGFNHSDYIYLEENPLDCEDSTTIDTIETLRSRGAYVGTDCEFR